MLYFSFPTFCDRNTNNNTFYPTFNYQKKNNFLSIEHHVHSSTTAHWNHSKISDSIINCIVNQRFDYSCNNFYHCEKVLALHEINRQSSYLTEFKSGIFLRLINISNIFVRIILWYANTRVAERTFMINQDPKVINLFKMQSNRTIPSIKLEGTYLYETNFFPGRLLAAEVYEDQIIIRPVFENEPMRFKI